MAITGHTMTRGRGRPKGSKDKRLSPQAAQANRASRVILTERISVCRARRRTNKAGALKVDAVRASPGVGECQCTQKTHDQSHHDKSPLGQGIHAPPSPEEHRSLRQTAAVNYPNDTPLRIQPPRGAKHGRSRLFPGYRLSHVEHRRRMLFFPRGDTLKDENFRQTFLSSARLPLTETRRPGLVRRRVFRNSQGDICVVVQVLRSLCCTNVAEEI